MESEYHLWPQRLILVKRWKKKLFSGVEVGFFWDLRSFLSSEVRKFTERINQSRQKGLCGRTKRLGGGNKPNCRAAASLTSWTKKQEMKTKKTCVCPADSYLGQHKDASAAAEVTLPPPLREPRQMLHVHMNPLSWHARKCHLLRERSQVRTRETLI